MPFDPIYLLYGAIFFGALLLIEGVYYFMADTHGGPEQTINRRLRMLASGQDGRKVMYTLRRQKAETKGFRGFGPIARLDQLIGQAGLSTSTGRMLGVMASLAAAVTLLFGVGAAVPIPLALMIGLGTGLILPILFLRRRKRVRLKKFGEQLPEAIDVMVRSIRAGHPLSSSIGLVSREMRDPIGSEFGLVSDEMTYGLGLQDALDNLARRVPLQDLQFMVVSIKIQHNTGGNLGEILSNLSKVIRDRFRMFGKINALSAEGRLSATIISALPFIAAGGMHLAAPKYFTQHSQDPLFWMIVGVGVVGLLLGIFVMYRMVNFRV
jgi:tight adherence protein B